MKRMFLGLLVATLVVAVTGLANAVTLDDAKAVSAKAAQYVKTSGKEAAIKEFQDPKGKFSHPELYVVLYDMSGMMLAHGSNPKLANHNYLDMKDPNTGKMFIKECIEIAKKGSGPIDYHWTNPATKKIAPKKAWVNRIEGTDLFTMIGMFVQ